MAPRPSAAGASSRTSSALARQRPPERRRVAQRVVQRRSSCSPTNCGLDQHQVVFDLADDLAVLWLTPQLPPGHREPRGQRPPAMRRTARPRIRLTTRRDRARAASSSNRRYRRGISTTFRRGSSTVLADPRRYFAAGRTGSAYVIETALTGADGMKRSRARRPDLSSSTSTCHMNGVEWLKIIRGVMPPFRSHAQEHPTTRVAARSAIRRGVLRPEAPQFSVLTIFACSSGRRIGRRRRQRVLLWSTGPIVVSVAARGQSRRDTRDAAKRAASRSPKSEHRWVQPGTPRGSEPRLCRPGPPAHAGPGVRDSSRAASRGCRRRTRGDSGDEDAPPISPDAQRGGLPAPHGKARITRLEANVEKRDRTITFGQSITPVTDLRSGCLGMEIPVADDAPASPTADGRETRPGLLQTAGGSRARSGVRGGRDGRRRPRAQADRRSRPRSTSGLHGRAPGAGPRRRVREAGGCISTRPDATPSAAHRERPARKRSMTRNAHPGWSGRGSPAARERGNAEPGDGVWVARSLRARAGVPDSRGRGGSAGSRRAPERRSKRRRRSGVIAAVIGVSSSGSQPRLMELRANARPAAGGLGHSGVSFASHGAAFYVPPRLACEPLAGTRVPTSSSRSIPEINPIWDLRANESRERGLALAISERSTIYHFPVWHSCCSG